MNRRHIRVVGAMLEQEGTGRYLITQRPPTASLPLLWEFPGGRVEPGETDEAALARELREELAADVEVLEQVSHTHHNYERYDVEFVVFRCRLRDPRAPLEHHKVYDHRWVTLEEMSAFRFPDADAKTLDKLLGTDGP